jgi:hypothetical protein
MANQSQRAKMLAHPKWNSTPNPVWKPTSDHLIQRGGQRIADPVTIDLLCRSL